MIYFLMLCAFFGFGLFVFFVRKGKAKEALLALFGTSGFAISIYNAVQNREVQKENPFKKLEEKRNEIKKEELKNDKIEEIENSIPDNDDVDIDARVKWLNDRARKKRER